MKNIEFLTKKAKSDYIEAEDIPYYAKVNYSISCSYDGARVWRKHFETYAVIHRYLAYVYDDYNKEIIRKRINGINFSISERFSIRPRKMPKILADAMFEMIDKKIYKMRFDI